ncbi:MAG: celC [Firmicutes bacterium]|jgi:PTS system cellobiose-specific IIA component|nr:celC [Bacillota bacterium]
MDQNTEMIAFNIILNSGNARATIHNAIKKGARVNNFEVFDRLIAEAENELHEAHNAQTQLLQDFAGGNNFTVDILMVHAQDHLMTTMVFKETAIELCELYKVINSLKK